MKQHHEPDKPGRSEPAVTLSPLTADVLRQRMIIRIGGEEMCGTR